MLLQRINQKETISDSISPLTFDLPKVLAMSERQRREANPAPAATEPLKNIFDILTVGAKFDPTRNGKEISFFSNLEHKHYHQQHHDLPHKVVKGSTSDAKEGPVVVNPAATIADAKHHVAIARPLQEVHSFFSFGNGDQDGTGDGEKKATAEEAADDDAAKHPVKPMSSKRRQNFLAKHSLDVKGKDLPQPMEHFSELVRPPNSLPSSMVSNLFNRHHRVPTPIQSIAIPALLRRRDVLACAPTGSGKTIAFLVPMFAHLKQPNPEGTVRAIIVSPTKELAVQIERETFFLMKGQRWRLVQHGQSTKGKDILVTTPLRVVELLKSKSIDLSAVEFIVFDEGDRLWDENTDFLKLMDTILKACTKPEKVISLFSATLPPKIEALAKTVMHDPVRIIVKGRTVTANTIEQKLLYTGNELGKIEAIRNMIREGLVAPVLIFVQSVERTKELHDEIKMAGLNVAIMNAKMSSEDRDETVLQFRLGKVWVLITTELLARGIDFKGVGTVINFDFPLTAESYVHRVGRTGRAGRKGLAITFFTDDDKERLPMVAKIISDSGGHVDEWMLKLKPPSRKRQRVLEKTTPQRMIVSTKKRMMVGRKRTERQLKAMAREGKGEADDDDDSGEDDE